MDISRLGPWAALAVIALYLATVAAVALIAAVHPDKSRRHDAHTVLDQLLRLIPPRRR